MSEVVAGFEGWQVFLWLHDETARPLCHGAVCCTVAGGSQAGRDVGRLGLFSV